MQIQQSAYETSTMTRIKIAIVIFPFIFLLSACNRDIVGSTRHIQNLKKCALLVRLSDLSDKADKHRSAGNNKKYQAILNYQIEKNTTIIKAFEKQYDFSPLYFFLSSDTKKLISGHYEGIFLNGSLEHDENIKLGCNDYLIADFGIIDPESNTDMANKWIIKDKNFEKLKKPFPYHVKFIDCLFAGGLENEIKCLNKKMRNFYTKVSQ